MRKIFKKLHLWLSIPFGLIISIICFSGAALVFETEITECCHPDRYFVGEVKEKPIPITELLTAVTSTLPDSVSVVGVTIPADAKRAYQVSLSKPRRASVYVDQYTGEVKEPFGRDAFFSFMFRTHRWLLDSMKPDGGIFWGKMIVGTSTLLLVFVLVTGVIIWVPKNSKALRNRLKISVKKGWKRFWYDLHVAGGIYAAVLLLMLALTGLTWSFSWYRTGFYSVFGVETQRRDSGRGQDRPSGRGQDRPSASFASWQQVYDQLDGMCPGYKQIVISAGSAHVVSDRMGNQRGSDRYDFDSETGGITGSTLYADQHKSDKIRGWIYSLHVGSWGGMLTKILTFIAACIGGLLPLTGYYFWIKRMVKKRF